MADQKITELNPAPFVADDDLLATVRDPGGTPTTRRATFNQVATMLSNNGNLIIPEAQIASGAVTTTKIGDNQVTDTKLRDSAARTVIGRAGATTGDPADIAIGADRVLGRSGSGDLASVQVETNMIANNQVDNTKLRDSGARTVIGRATSTTGDPADIAIGADRVLGRSGSGDLASVQVATNMIANDAVTETKLDAVSTTATIASGFTGQILLRRIGNTVWAFGRVFRTGSTSTLFRTVATVPSGFFAAVSVSSLQIATSAGWRSVFIDTTAANAIQVSGITNGEDLQITLMWTV